MTRLTDRIGPMLRDMPPAYFALVMSTGIVSIACHLSGWRALALSLFWLNLAIYLILWLLIGLRLIFYPRRVLGDFQSHFRGVGFFTLIAGTCLLGSQAVLIMGSATWGTALLVVGAALWVGLVYGVLTSLIIGGENPSLRAGINGNWLVATVSTQSLAILTTLLAAHFSPHQEVARFLALCLFSVGGVLYLIIITLIFYRFMFFEFAPQAFEPPYWIASGADSISTLAGATLVAQSHGSPLLEPLRSHLAAFTVFFWAFATWWLPLLIILLIWRHLFRGIKISYTPAYWGMVFPLGMYATCTWYLSGLLGFPFLLGLARGFLYAALVVWALAFLGMCGSLLRSLQAES